MHAEVTVVLVEGPEGGDVRRSFHDLIHPLYGPDHLVSLCLSEDGRALVLRNLTLKRRADTGWYMRINWVQKNTETGISVCPDTAISSFKYFTITVEGEVAVICAGPNYEVIVMSGCPSVPQEGELLRCCHKGTAGNEEKINRSYGWHNSRGAAGPGWNMNGWKGRVK